MNPFVSSRGPHLTGSPHPVGEQDAKALGGDTPRPHGAGLVPSVLQGLFPAQGPHGCVPTWVSGFCTDRPRRSSFWLTKFTMACPRKNRDPGPGLGFATLRLRGPESPRAAHSRVLRLSRCPPGHGAVSGSPTSFTALTFSGASLRSSSKTSPADRAKRHLTAMPLSTCPMAFCPQKCQSGQSRGSCSFVSGSRVYKPSRVCVPGPWLCGSGTVASPLCTLVSSPIKERLTLPLGGGVAAEIRSRSR